MGLFTSFGAVVNITYMHVVMYVAGPFKGLEWWLSYISVLSITAIIVPMTVDTVRLVLLMMGVCTARNM